MTKKKVKQQDILDQIQTDYPDYIITPEKENEKEEQTDDETEWQHYAS